MLVSSVPSDAPLPDGRPFAVEITFVPEPVPEGQHGNCLFQAMAYTKSGFRLGLHRDMRVWVASWVAPGKQLILKSRTQLLAGREYDTRARWDGENVMLYINGQLDAAMPAPFPAPFSGTVFVGKGSGCPGFRGVIQRVAVFTLAG